MKNNKASDEHISRKKSGSEVAVLQIWKQLEDVLVPRLRLSVVDRAVYSYLLRNSRLEGKLRLHFSIHWLARGACLSSATVRESVRRLIGKGALRLVERSKAGHVVEVRLPEEIRAARPDRIEERDGAGLPSVANLEETDFLESRALRESIHAREGGACFYCLRRVTARTRCLDHVVPRVRSGRNSYRNLVSSCGDCNSQKGEEEAGDFLRKLYRDGRLTAAELTEQLHKLEALAAGELRPILPTPGPQFGVGARFSASQPKPQSGAGALKPAPATYKRFPVWSQSNLSNPKETKQGEKRREALGKITSASSTAST